MRKEICGFTAALTRQSIFILRSITRTGKNCSAPDRCLPAALARIFTSRGLLETDLGVGDVIRIGTVVMQVLQPRSPCYKLQMKFDRPDMVALFMRQNRPGWYASVLQEGTLTKSDAIEIVSRAPERISIADIWHYSLKAELDEKTRRQVSGLDLLPAFWKERIIRT
jgi:MOSC domain-containing protein YiiM